MFAPAFAKTPNAMIKLLPIAAAATLLATACAEDNKETTFENGDRLVVHTDAPGDPIVEGDLVTFHIDVYNADSLINSSRDVDPEGTKAIAPPRDSVAEATNTFLRVLRMLSEGDSATIYQVFDTIQPLPPGIDRDAGLRVEIVIKSVGDSTEATAFQENLDREQAAVLAARAAYAERRDVVQDSVETLLDEYRRRGADRAGFTTTASGLKYKILEPGSGPQPQQGEYVTVSYYGALAKDGVQFDDSFGGPRGEGITFPLGAGQVIRGWDEGVALLNQGARAIFVIPSDLAYGDRDQRGIPANSDLGFYVQLDNIQ